MDNDSPWNLEAFQQAFIADLFSGVSVAWLVMPEGNAKTTLTSGIALHHAEHHPNASVPVAASSREQAELLYQQAKGFVQRTPRLARIFECFDGYRRIDCTANGAKIKIYAADERTGDGVIPTLAIVEELHRHKNLRLYRLWRGKIEKRGGKILVISTAGEPGSEFEAARDAMRSSPQATITRNGSLTKSISAKFVLHDWAVPEDGDVEDLKTVKTANPLKAITIQRLRSVRNDPAMTLEHWRRFNCNLPTRGSSAAITEAAWQLARSKQAIPAGQAVWLGLDIAWAEDTTALVPMWPKSQTERILGPAIVLPPPQDGTLHPDEIKKAILAVHAANPIAVVVMDMFRAADIAAWIPSATGARVIARSQLDATATIDFEKFMEALRNGWLWHQGDAALTDHAMNVLARSLPSGKTRFERPNWSERKGRRVQPIDALIAAAMVNGEYAAPYTPTAQRWSVV